MAEFDIIVKAQDLLSEPMRRMADNAKPLDKAFEDLNSRMQQAETRAKTFNEAYAALSVQVADAKKAVQEAKKAFQKDPTDSNDDAWQAASLHVKELTDQMDTFRQASKDNRAEMRNMRDEARKMADDPGTGFGNTLTALARAGLGQMVGQSVQQYANYAISSAFDSQTGTVLSSALGSAISGAAIGSMAGPLGTAIGGAVGAASGLLQGVTANETNKDAAMQSYAQNLTQTAENDSASSLTTGSSIAAQRQQDLLSFGTLLGSPDAAASVLGSIQTMANSTPYLYNDLTQIAKTLSVYGYNQSNIMGALSTIGDTGSALSMSTEDMDSVAQILGYIGSGDTLDSMKLKQLRLKGINANQMLQDYYGISATELNNRVSGGKISGTDAASIILKEMQSTFGGMMQQQSETFTGLTSTVEGLQQEIDNAKGNGYNTTRESSLQDEIDSLGGNLGAKLKSVNGIIGEAEGTKANIEQQILQDVMGGVFNGTSAKEVTDKATLDKIAELRDDYLQASDEYRTGDEQQRMEAGAKMDSIMTQAEALASSSQDTNDKLDVWDQAALDTAGGVASIVTVLQAWRDNWNIGQTQGRGRGAYTQDDSNLGDWSVNAFGLNYVPYDNFPALLHQGERVQTAAEARADKGAGRQITIHIDHADIRKDTDVYDVAVAMVDELERREQTAG